MIQEMQNMDFSFEWGERTSLWLHDFFSYGFMQHENLLWNDISNSIVYVINPDECGGYIKADEFKERGQKLGEFFLDPKRIPWLMCCYEDILKELENYLKWVEQSNFSNMSKEDLLPFFKEFVRINNKTACWYRGTRHEAEYEAEKIIKKELEKKFKDFNEKFRILTSSPHSDPIIEEKDDWLELLGKKVNEKDYKQHIKKHSMFFTNIYTEEQLMTAIKERYEKDKKRIEFLKKDNLESKKKKEQLKQEQKKIIKKINFKKVLPYVNLFHRFGEYRFRLKPGYAGVEILSLDMLSRIGEHANMSVRDMHELLTIKETLEFLKTGRLPKKEILEQRKECRVHIIHNKKQYTIQGKEGMEFLKNTVFKIDTNVKELKGTPASPGKIKGRVKVVMANQLDKINKITEEFKKGDILVTQNTQPPMVPLMTKASAIVTAQGGITSHSAVVSREFNIPCIVGIDSVTMFLKDGELIEVDATKGIVKKLE